MSVKHLSNCPKCMRRIDNRRRVEPDWWFYEDSTGLLIVRDRTADPANTQAIIPWSSIRRALSRLDKVDSKQIESRKG